MFCNITLKTQMYSKNKMLRRKKNWKCSPNVYFSRRNKNQKLSDEQAAFKNGKGNRGQIANIC